MASTTPKMGLNVWDKPLDPYDYVQLANDWNIVDFHDHSPGRGVQISTAGIANGAVGVAQLSSAVPIVPTGAIFIWPLAAAPAGYLLCNGAAVSQATYAALYAVIGNTYANSPGTGLFNVPHMTGPSSATPTVVTTYIIKT